PFKLLEHPRFRAGYDFLLLRCESGELPGDIGEWWTAFYAAEGGEREALLAAANARLRNGEAGQGRSGEPQKRKRPPRRGPRKGSGGEGGEAPAAQGGGEE
ncbi:MAG: polynucleotide adenylyltransferase PcnB, partial [Candidatus Accumulibacter sp.]|nr:polynucleotide adenylyltransferase PcnB [Accumulibacter sp.]